MKNHEIIQMAYRHLLSDHDRQTLDPVRMYLQAELRGCGPAGSVELLYRLGRLLNGHKVKGRKV